MASIGYRLTNETYRVQADTTPGTASRDLRALVDSGLLEAQGEKRGRSCTATTDLAERWRHAAAAIPSQERIDPYLTGDAFGPTPTPSPACCSHGGTGHSSNSAVPGRTGAPVCADGRRPVGSPSGAAATRSRLFF